MDLRVLVHAPRGRDAAVVQSVLGQQRIACHVCASVGELLRGLAEGAASAILTEEALPALLADDALLDWLSRQPPWSDFPFIVLASKREGRRADKDHRTLHSLGNLVLLERPLNAETLASAADSAVRARQRQYATREHLDELGQTRRALEQLNGELEHRIRSRTDELARANERLRQEIGERERAQAALAQAQKMESIGRLTGGIAHDFNNLLHVITMNLELVSLYARDDKLRPVVERAKNAARRGARLTSQLLSFARSKSLLPRLTSVNRLLLGIKDLLDISAGSAITVRIDPCEEDVTVLVDSGQMEMAILNLVVNSRDAMPHGGLLTISVRTRVLRGGDSELPAGSYVVVQVCDEGVGIPSHLLPKVFDPFFTTKPVGSGTGLGLSQVYGFARQSGGLARARSAEGQGTTVEMLFPRADEEWAEAGPAQGAATLARPAHSRHILVVEDDAEVRRVIVECLSVIGYQVSEAACGRDGLAALDAARPDLLVVDYAMPDMTGAEMISRARERIGAVPVILATGYADMEAVERLAGKLPILRKPFDLVALGETVNHLLLEGVESSEAPALGPGAH